MNQNRTVEVGYTPGYFYWKGQFPHWQPLCSSLFSLWGVGLLLGVLGHFDVTILGWAVTGAGMSGVRYAVL